MKNKPTYSDIMAKNFFSDHVHTLTMYYILDELADYILDPFAQLQGDDIDG